MRTTYQIPSSDGPPLPLPRDRGCSGDQRSTKRPVRVEKNFGEFQDFFKVQAPIYIGIEY